MKKVHRYFTQTRPTDENGKRYLQGLSSFFGNHCVVVLGDPVIGKTFSFLEAAKEEPNALFVPISRFLNYPINRFKGKTLYLDGLDEQRSKAANSDIVDTLAGRLIELDFPKVRISCRTLDWHGESEMGNR